MIPYTHTIHPDEFFSPETKKKFLQIPHRVNRVHPKIEIIDFDVPENGKYPLLSRNKIVNILEPLTKEDHFDIDVRQHTYSTGYGYIKNSETGLFIMSNHGSSIEYFIKEIYKYDKTLGEDLLDSYHKFANTCSDIISIEERMIRQFNQLNEFLVKENISVVEYDIDYKDYAKKSEDEQIKIIDKLYEKYGDGYSFESYNDLDYTPYMSNGDFYMYDSSGARLYIVKSDSDSQKIYMINNDDDRREVEMEDGMSDFAHSHYQGNLLLAKQILPTDLIGEIKNSKIIKSSLELTDFDRMTSQIVDQLYEEGKIVNTVPKLTFDELLDNYTLQKEFYQFKERAFLDIFKEIKLIDGILTYQDFSVMKETDTFKVKHEDFSVHTTRDIKKSFQQNENLKIKDLPQEYKEEIDSYLYTLVNTYPNKETEKTCEYIRQQMIGISKKLKM